MRSNTTHILGSIAIAFALTSTPVSASDTQTDFRYSQSELSTFDGAQNVYGRISNLATELCETEFGRFNPRNQARKERCKRDVKQELMEKIDHLNLEKVSVSKATSSRKDHKVYKVTSR